MRISSADNPYKDLSLYITERILFIAGDVFYVNWEEVLTGATAVVSTIGGFGNEEQMQRINGEANVVAVNAAKDFGKTISILLLKQF